MDVPRNEFRINSQIGDRNWTNNNHQLSSDSRCTSQGLSGSSRSQNTTSGTYNDQSRRESTNDRLKYGFDQAENSSQVQSSSFRRSSNSYDYATDNHLSSATSYDRRASNYRQYDPKWSSQVDQAEIAASADSYSERWMLEPHVEPPRRAQSITCTRRLQSSSLAAERFDQEEAQRCTVRVCIKLPHQVHRIVICPSPRLILATEVDQ